MNDLFDQAGWTGPRGENCTKERACDSPFVQFLPDLAFSLSSCPLLNEKTQAVINRNWHGHCILKTVLNSTCITSPLIIITIIKLMT